MSTHRKTQETSRLPDETIMQIINEKMDGASFTFLSKKYEVANGTLVGWCNGLTKCHLYDKVVEERYRQRKIVPIPFG